MTKRSEAVVEFVTSTVLAVTLYRFRDSKHAKAKPKWSSPWIAVGAVSAALTHWQSDTEYDAGTSRWQRIALSVGKHALGQVALREREQRTNEFDAGKMVGIALYRLHYGVLGAPPGEE